MTIEDFISRLPSAKKSGNGYSAKCPAHTDGTASLSISEGDDGRTLLHCHAGCTTEAICAAVNLTLADLFPRNKTRNGSGKQIGATYDYHDASGKVVFQVVRFEPKDFRQRKPDAIAPDGWTWNTKGVEKVLFRLPEILRDVKTGKFIFLCEGEKDVLKMAARGFSATCNPGGACKWQDSFTETLRGADVVIIADKDKAGREHAQIVAGKLHGVAKSVRVLELPDNNGKPVKDAHDYFAAGGTAESLILLVDAAPTWTPQAAPEIKTESSNAADSFDKITSDIRGYIIGLLSDKNAPPSAQRREICGQVIAALNRVGRFYFHTELRDFDSALFFNRFTKRLERLRADAFTSWLSEWLCINRADALFKYVIAAVETEALSGERTTGILPESFWASRPGAIYFSNGDGRAAKITANGVQLVDNGTDGVLFAAGRTLQPWKITTAQDIFQTCSIFRNARCAASHALDLIRLWIYSLPTIPRSKPPLCLAGEIQSGKTRLAKAIAEFFGIPFVAAKVEQSKEDDFWPCVDAGGIYTLDNADTKTPWLPDALANAATDGCSQRRKLYSNAGTVTLRPRAWICVTTANPTFASDAGLADRLLLVRMARRDDQETSDAALTDEILANRDAGLSHLAETLRAALADTAPTPAGLNRRHPDFAAFAVRIGRALNRETEAVAALKHAEADKSAFCLENDSIGAALLAYLRTAQTFTGTAAELVPKLVEMDGELAERLSAKRLAKRLSAIWPHLQSTLATASKETDRKGFLVFRFKSVEIADFEMPFS
jgi:hypothetical protein